MCKRSPTRSDDGHRSGLGEVGGIFDLINLPAEREIDFALVKPVVPYADLRRDAPIVEMGTARVPVASIPHLIAMKTGTGRGKDRIDIDELKELMPVNAP